MRIGLAGIGIVGTGVVQLLNQQQDDIFFKTGHKFEIVAVAALDKNKKRTINLENIKWVENPIDLAHMDDVDVVVEVMGGDGEPALSLITTALKTGKPVVTANKALIAKHGFILAGLSETQKTPLLFEAAVAGGIPVIKTMREGLSANRIDAIHAILNGTCNYILTTMEKTGKSFTEILDTAKSLGYAESDSSLDINGEDSAHKLAILSSIAFDIKPDLAGISINGIKRVEFDDIIAAGNLGYKIKLIAQTMRINDNKILQMVAPTLVPKTSPIAHIDEALNAIEIINNFAGTTFMAGRGAGARPTASAIVADLIDIACGRAVPYMFGKKIAHLEHNNSANLSDWWGNFYLRLLVEDKAGVIADIAPILRDHDISISSMVQYGSDVNKPVKIIVITHKTTGAALNTAIQKISQLNSVITTPFFMPIL